ncbi:uncharacterized protein LY79DRAFT_303341 [Colletotrichum navitas]|uniref:Uncharacterized protein n=1 Tax=Colletotrichum navitas TaxID=681940 RepID=A0AAD8PTQ2_9PEZI|nr:uncharacterized protein LY79DRAFT_303341 [Colletotrichum navitas]KAK1580534.1 hypothetical protein LY79DRAFT_303341 [Colletotrichum navitas]
MGCFRSRGPPSDRNGGGNPPQPGDRHAGSRLSSTTVTNFYPASVARHVDWQSYFRH